MDMSPFRQTGQTVRRYLADRLAMLEQTIDNIGSRLREGIASAIGETVSAAAQAAVRSFLAGLQPSPALATEERHYGNYDPYTANEPTHYYDGWENPKFEPAVDIDEPPLSPPRLSRWRVAITAAVQVLAFWLRKPPGGRTLLMALGVAAVTGAAALFDGPIAATGAAVLGTTLSLLNMTDGTRSWVARFARASATH
jgi:hypothetical protein